MRVSLKLWRVLFSGIAAHSRHAWYKYWFSEGGSAGGAGGRDREEVVVVVVARVDVDANEPYLFLKSALQPIQIASDGLNIERIYHA